MVRALRNSVFGQLFLGAIVVAIILAFALTGTTPAGGDLGDECAVEVGESCVEPKEFLAAYGLLTSIGINEQASERLQLRKQVALGLAERTVLVKKARELGIATSEEDVDTHLAEGRTRLSLPAQGAERLAMSLALCVDGPMGCEPGTIGIRSMPVKVGGTFNYDRYERMVRVRTGRSPAQFKEMQQREHTAERVRQLIRSQVRVSDEEAFLAYRRARSQAVARVAKLDTKWFQRFVIAPSEEQIEAWVAEHGEELAKVVEGQKESWAEGCAVVSAIRLPASSANPDDDEKSPTEVLEGVRRKLRSGVSFDELAREYDTSPAAALGGRVGCVTAAQDPQQSELAEAAAELQEPGDLSPVVDTPAGPMLVRLEQRLTAESREQALRDHLAYRLTAEALADEAARKFAEALIEKLGSGAAISEAVDELTGETLREGALGEEAAEEDSVALEAPGRPLSDISRPFSIEQSPVPDAAAGEKPSVLVFELDEPDQVVNRPIETRSGYAVLQLKELDLVDRERFAEERDQIVAQLRSRKAEEALGRYVSELIEREGGVTLNESYVPPPKADDDSPEG